MIDPARAEKIFGYASPWSVAPGETVRFMVSSPDAAAYRMQLYRLLQPDVGPAGTPFAPEPVIADCNGWHQARHQPIALGSHGDAPLPEDLSLTQGFTLLACVSPYTPLRGRQALLGSWLEHSRTGFGLEIDIEGQSCLRIAGGSSGDLCISSGRPMRPRAWYLVAACADPVRQRVDLWQVPLPEHGFELDEIASNTARWEDPAFAPMPKLTFAAWPAGAEYACHFNGKIASPRLFAAAHNFETLCKLVNRPEIGTALVAAWNFGHCIPGDEIHDQSPHRLHGVVHNQPTRGVPGPDWEIAATSTTNAQRQDAIHFHEDDLADAAWTPDAEFRIPGDLRSGIYSARLSVRGSDFWVPFFVRPAPGARRAPTVFLVPTATYIAYLNHRGRLESLASERLYGKLNIVDPVELLGLEFPAGLSTYDRHRDGSGVCHSTRLRPAFNLQPNGRLWNFPMDLLIIDWLEHCGGDYDVITDEDLHVHGAELLRHYRLLVTGSHPEYVSAAMLDAIETHVRGGGRLMYLGGNGFYWRTAFHPEKPGLLEVRRMEGVRSWEAEPGARTLAFSGEPGGLWRTAGRAPQRLTGVGFISQGFDTASAYTLLDAARDPRFVWALQGVTDHRLGDAGLAGGGAAGLEIDATDATLGTPSHHLIVARSSGHSNAYLMAVEETPVPHGATGATLNSRICSEIVFFEVKGGGAVFSVGSIAYAGALAANTFDNDLCRLTTNVLRRFADETEQHAVEPAQRDVSLIADLPKAIFDRTIHRTARLKP